MGLMAVSVLLPDTAPMSPRSIVIAGAGLLLALVVLLQSTGFQDNLNFEHALEGYLGTYTITVKHTNENGETSQYQIPPAKVEG